MSWEMQIRATLITELLGSQPANEQVYTDFVRAKAPEGTEDEPLNYDPDEKIEKGTTIFHRDENGNLCVRDYQIKGHIKYIGDQLRKLYGTTKGANKSGWESWKPNVNFFVHIYPRYIPLIGVTEPSRINERPLRAMTMQGERVSLARSEEVVPGTQFEFGVVCTGLIKPAQIIECLDQGESYGIGQWRNAGFGRYEYEIIKQTERAVTNKHEIDKSKPVKTAKKVMAEESEYYPDDQE